MRTMIAALVVLSAIMANSAAGEDKKRWGDWSKERDIEAKASELVGSRYLVERYDYASACFHFTMAVVFGGTKYKGLLDGVKVIMDADQIDACTEQVRNRMEIERIRRSPRPD